ncbi:hypothetical protein Taro_026722 [Colocasia esculenta]|uniref:Uncharacterized protein n=1 Tax=Colocasia esculenta TaxID=4460 RepID=A0A843V6V5_COLES|nr:hypothetical protein [Colocasia esculenta]
MAGAHHSCPAPSDSTGSSSLPEKGRMIGAKRSSSVDTSSGSVDTRDSSQNNLLDNLGQCVDTSSSSVDTRGLPRTPSGLFWDSVSTLDQVVSTLVALPEKKMSQISGLMQSVVEEDYDFPQLFSTSPALQTCYSRPQLVAKPSQRV